MVAYIRQQDPPSTGTTPTRPRTPTDNPPTALITPTSTRATSATSAKEAIYDRPIGPELLLLLPMDKAAVRRIVTNAIQTAVAQIAATAAPAPAQDGNATPSVAAPLAVIPTRWNAAELGFFDPQYNDKTVHSGAAPIEHADKNTYFRDVHLFIDRAKQFVLTKKEDLIRENL